VKDLHAKFAKGHHRIPVTAISPLSDTP